MSSLPEFVISFRIFYTLFDNRQKEDFAFTPFICYFEFCFLRNFLEIPRWPAYCSILHHYFLLLRALD